MLIFLIRKTLFNWYSQRLVPVSGRLQGSEFKFIEDSHTDDIGKPSQLVGTKSASKSENKSIKTDFDEQYLTKGFDAINKLFLQNSTSEDINQLVLSQLCKHIRCYHAALYKADDEKETLTLVSSYGLTKTSDKITINYGDGMVGQAVLDNEQLILREVPSGYVKVASGLGQTDPQWIGVFPLSFKGKAHGVLELCFLYSESELIKGHLEKVAELFGAHFFNQGVIAKQSQLQQLEQEKLRSEAILEGCADGFIGFNRHGIIDFCNKSAAELIRLKKEDVLGQSIGTLLGVSIEEHDEDNYQIIHHGIEQTTLTEKTEIQITDSHNEEIDVLVTANTISVAGDILFTLFLQKISVDLF